MSKFIYILLVASLIYSRSDVDNITLEYSVLYKKMDSQQFESLDSGSNIESGNILKFNIQFLDSLICYIIHKDPIENISFLYNSADSIASDTSSNLTFYSTGELMIHPPSGQELIYFILSTSRLNDLEEILYNYKKSNGARAKKFRKQFLLKISDLYSLKDKSISIQSRLDKPIIGGVSFRGEDENINNFSLTHSISDYNLILNEVILNHIDVE